MLEVYKVTSRQTFEAAFREALLDELSAAGGAHPDSTEQRLQELDQLRDRGLINKDDYDRKRRELLRTL
jgi:hypothetical protein